ncbi:MAG: PQQ-dependent sugar dehydrogenase [Verrucomicrobium sp.]
MRHKLTLASLLALSGSLSPALLPAADAPPDYRFKVETLFESIAQPMEIELAADGRLFYNEYKGSLKIYHPDTKQVATAGDLQVFNGQENGFLGFALDPKFAENGYVYCLYSPKDFDGQQLSRFKMNGDALDLASEKVVLRFEEQRKECCHHAGTVEFGPDGCLYFSAGDNTHPHGDSGGYAPIDGRPERSPWDAQKSASNTNVLNGKINRIRVKADGTYEIPEGNLFPAGTPKTRPEIFVMGCRNPWRMSVDSKTGYVYWGEVGPDAGNDGPRGPRGYDEINQAKKAGNFGWPYFIGNNFAYNRYDYATKTVGTAFDPAHPVNEGVNNTGLRELPPAQPAMIYWPYREPREFQEMGEGGRTACAGPVFYWQPEFEKTNGFPKDFDGWLLFWDWERPTIRWARMGANANFQGIAPFTAAVVTANKPEAIDKVAPQVQAGAFLMKRPVDAVFGPDGCLYIMDYGETWGANKDARMVKISYLRGNLPPLARATVTPTSGREPLTVKLSAAGSKDHEGDALKYEWRLLPEGKVVSSNSEGELRIDQPGNYQAELKVTDAQGATGIATATFIVGNTQPEVQFESPQTGDFFDPGKPVTYAVVAKDAEDGDSTAKPDEFGLRTLVSTAFLDAMGKEQASDPGLALMKSSDCFNCHGIEQRIVGPAYVEIADKYRGQPAALEAAVNRVRNGSTGVWGPLPMLPHPQHTTDEVTIMLRWAFSLEKGKGGPTLARGLTGTTTAPKSDKPGEFVLEATYTDAGRSPAGTLSGKATAALRTRRWEVEDATIDGPKISGNGSASGKKVIGSINDKHTVLFPHVNLDQVGGFTVRGASGNVGGVIEFHAGSPDGPLLGTVEMPNTGGWDKWIEPTVRIPADKLTHERKDVYAVFVNPGKGGLMNLDWVQFDAR